MSQANTSLFTLSSSTLIEESWSLVRRCHVFICLGVSNLYSTLYR